MDMGALLDLEDSQPGHLRRGEIVEGMVMGTSPDGVIVDVGTKMEAVIPQNEMLSLGAEGVAKLKTGDTVRVMVLQPSSAEGHAIVSLDRARGEEGWDVLAVRHESGETFAAQVTGHNRGGILVNVEGVNAFVPLSQVDSVRRDDPDAASSLANLVGKSVMLKVVELNRKRNRVILSERAAMAEHRKEAKEKVLDELKEGEIHNGRVSSITDFGVFVDLGGADGLAHMTELTWERGKKARDLYTVGDDVQAYILKIDRETKKISLSLKRAQPEKWDTTVNRFVIGQILIGRVTKLMAFGAFVRLDGPVEGLIHISELSNRRIQHPKDVVKEGDVVPVKLVRIEKDRHRLGLSLRQARNDAEAMGFAFDMQGAVTDYPDDVREQFSLPAREKREGGAPRGEPKTTQEAIERAVARDPEPVSAFAHAFAQALEKEETSTGVDADEIVETASPSAETVDNVETASPVAETDEIVETASSAAETVDIVETASPVAETVEFVAEVVVTASSADGTVAEETGTSAEVTQASAEATVDESPIQHEETGEAPKAAEPAEEVATAEESTTGAT
jgi:small subunit ribosomal protein S1